MDGGRYNPKLLAQRWLDTAKADVERVQRERDKFFKISGGIGSTQDRDAAVVELQSKRAIPVTQFSLARFARNFRLRHNARVADAKGRAPCYAEPCFAELASVLENTRNRNMESPRDIFMERHGWERSSPPPTA